MITFDEITMAPTGKYIRSGPFGKKELRSSVTDVQVRLNGSYLCMIPAGFESDGMSFPWWQATWDDPWHYRYIAAALLHDYLLSIGYEKAYADWLFMLALISYDVPALECYAFWVSVRTKR